MCVIVFDEVPHLLSQHLGIGIQTHSIKLQHCLSLTLAFSRPTLLSRES